MQTFEEKMKIFQELPVFITGHTGFKGCWLSLWLGMLGAHVTGFSLPADKQSLFSLISEEARMGVHLTGDIRDGDVLTRAMSQAHPTLVFHLAAQALVRPSYEDPVGTWETNLMGTVQVLEAVRQCPSVKAMVLITTDKCYENKEWEWGYRENDALGGYDPYSASKAACELAIDSYKKSFLQDKGILVASVRAGNVIGGGDYGQDRLIPDAVRAIVAGKDLEIRHPEATRPWQHVLCALHGYLLLASGLLEGREDLACPYNFGPSPKDNRTVADILADLQLYWPELHIKTKMQARGPHEASFLYLDASRAHKLLEWIPAWNLAFSLERTALWYRRVRIRPQLALSLCLEDIKTYMVKVGQ